MSTSSNPRLASKLFAMAARLREIAPGLRPGKTALALACGLAVLAFAAGPQSAKDAWLKHNAPLRGVASAAESAASFLAISSPQAQPTEMVLAAAQPFHDSRGTADRERAAQCLAAAAWYEAGNDPVGQRAVIQTVVNRVNNASFPNTICGVVFEGSQLSTGCQFTFTCDGSLERRRPSASAWESALELSRQALGGFVEESIGTATHYHAAYVSPWWSSKLERLSTVGPHIFYRWPDGRGTLPRQRRLGAEETYADLRQRSIADPVQLEIAAALPSTFPSTKALSSGLSAPPSQPAMPQRTAIFLAVSESEPSGRWALAAMKACKGRTDCQVLAYSGADQLLSNQARVPAERSRPMFLFIRDAASAMTIALWDCQKVARPSEQECLPADGARLANLLRDRRTID